MSLKTGKEFPAIVWILAMAASVPVAYLLDHFVIEKHVPLLHDCAAFTAAFTLGKAKLNLPGEWGILAAFGVPLLVAAILAFPFRKGWSNRFRAYRPRALKVLCVFLALPLGFAICAVVSPFAESKIPVDYVSASVSLLSGRHELGELECSLIVFPVVYLILYELFWRLCLPLRREKGLAA